MAFWQRQQSSGAPSRRLHHQRREQGGGPMPKEPDMEHPTAENARPPRETWRILFLDNAAAIEQLKSACKDVGYVVIGATTIDEAFAFLDGENHADVIVCAAHLEQESMFNFLKAVRDSHVHRNSKF